MTGDDTATERSHPDRWPEPKPEQVEVMLLGCYHMDDPGLDVVNVEADDVLADDRQQELAALVERLSLWEPDAVAVERPVDEREAVVDLYRKYVVGERNYDDGGPDDSTQPDHGVAEARSEVVQVGFRLADRLGHDRVYPVDDHVRLADRFDEETQSRYDGEDVYRVPPARRERYGLPDPDGVEREETLRLQASTIPEYLAWLNEAEQLTSNHREMFAAAIPFGETEPPAGPTALAVWYERNLRTVHHLWRAAGDGSDRILLVVGSGHVRVLRHLLHETPMCCPVSALPYVR